MEYHLRKINEEVQLVEEFYKIEAESLREAMKKVQENDPYLTRYIPGIDYTE